MSLNNIKNPEANSLSSKHRSNKVATSSGYIEARLNGTEDQIIMHDDHNIEFGENESVCEKPSTTDQQENSHRPKRNGSSFLNFNYRMGKKF